MKKILILLLTLMLTYSCKSILEDNNKNNKSENISTPEQIINREKKENIKTDIADIKNIMIVEIINNLSLEEKIGQLFIIGLKDLNGYSALHIDEYIVEFINTYNPGGFILFAGNFYSVEQTYNLNNDLQRNSSIPLFIATDEEGGLVSRFSNTETIEATHFPAAEIIGWINDPELAYKIGRIIGSELHALGINMNFAPVADLNTNPLNPVIGSRSYGEDPVQTGILISSIIEGLQFENVCSVIKHFPGHGDTNNDSHHESVYVNHTMERLETVELVPFKMGIDAGADGVMTAHIILSILGEEQVPASLSSFVLQDILRNNINHNKLIITDAMNMDAITEYWPSGEAAKLAIKAGADIILLPFSFEEAYTAILDAVRSGEILEERIDESLYRILNVKYIRNILDSNPSEINPELIIGCTENQQILEEISNRLN